jgi:UDP-N-acetylmuramoyl-tripeptide--D-alanyl-D-alanine ligase
MLDLDTAARQVGAGRRGANVSFFGVSTDSRHISHGDLFVALRGERYDGHEFVDQALEDGAAAAMVADTDRIKRSDAPLILVEDTRVGLGRLAAAWRQRFAIPLVAVTGSNGKTTVKEMIAEVLRAAAGDKAVLATSGNLNNDIGVPLMLLRLRSHHRYAVIEMGMNHLGEIRYLTGLARPTVALITNAGTAHIGELGSRDAIAQAKAEIYEGLDAQGVALINADDAYARYWLGLNEGRAVVEFGMDRPATVRARCQLGAEGSTLSVHTPTAEYQATLNVPGLHNARNALAACAVAHVLGIAPAYVTRALGYFEGAKGRLQRKPAKSGAVLIDDTYNANPDSVRAAIAVLAACAGMRVLVLGDMGELGADAERMHVEMGDAAKAAGIQRLFTLGELSEGATRRFGSGAQHYRDLDALCDALVDLLAPQVTVLIKGSRFMRMERVVERLLQGRAESGGGGH